MSYRDFLKLCQNQNGLITSAQAHRMGLSNVEIHRLVARGDLYRMRRGVYRHEAVPAEVCEEITAVWMSLYPAMTAAERRAQPHLGVLRTETAAMVLGLGDLQINKYGFYVPERKNITANDVELHREALSADEIVIVRGLPVTTPTRTIVDLLGEMREPLHIGEAVSDAIWEGLELDSEGIREALGPYTQATGISMESAQYLILEEPFSRHEQAA
jgi:predicted transcriptional regulator of viral defense system